MPPKKSAKSKKEEVVQIPDVSALPSGPRTFFIGGWSVYQHTANLSDVSRVKDSGESVLILPGTYALGTAEAKDEETAKDGAVQLRQMTVAGVAKADLEPQQERPVAAAADEEEGEADEEHDDADDDETPDPTRLAKLAPEPEHDASVVVQGPVTFTRYVPPPEPEPPQEEKPVETKPAPKGKRGAKRVSVHEEPTTPVVTPEAAILAQATGADPENWPTVTFERLCFTGAVSVRGVHAVFRNCHFAGPAAGGEECGAQLSVHQYASVSLEGSTFSAPTRTAVYAYPLSTLTVVDCVFTGGSYEAEAVLAQAQAAAPRSAAPTPVMGSPARARAPDAALVAEMEKVRARAAEAAKAGNSVGIYADNPQAMSVSMTRFRAGLTTGIVMHDKCGGARVFNNEFRDMLAAAAHLDGCAGTFERNHEAGSAYHAVRCTGKCTAKVLRCKLQAKLRIDAGARPVLHSNALAVPVDDRSATEFAALSPVY